MVEVKEINSSQLFEEVSSELNVEVKEVKRFYDSLVDKITSHVLSGNSVKLKGLLKIYPFETKAKKFYNCAKGEVSESEGRTMYKARMSDSFNRKQKNQ